MTCIVKDRVACELAIAGPSPELLPLVTNKILMCQLRKLLSTMGATGAKPQGPTQTGFSTLHPGSLDAPPPPCSSNPHPTTRLSTSQQPAASSSQRTSQAAKEPLSG